MRFFSIDIETTGLDCDTDQILEFAMVDSLTRKVCHHYVKHDVYRGHPIALAMNAKILQILGEGKDPRIVHYSQLIDCIIGWAVRELGFNQNFADPIRINIAGKNVDFDLSFIGKLPRTRKEGSSLILGSCLKLRNRKLDPAILYFQPSDQELPNLKTCCARAGIELKNEHSAVDDAWAVYELLKIKGLCDGVDS